MNDLDILKTSKFYNIKTDNFTSKITKPIILVILLSVICSFLSLKDLHVETMGQVTSSNNPIVLEIKDNEIDKIYFKENSLVKKNDIIIKNKNGSLIKSKTDGELFIVKNPQTNSITEITIYPKNFESTSSNVISYVNNEDINYIKKGQSVSFQLGDKFYKGKVLNVSNVSTLIDHQYLFAVTTKVNFEEKIYKIPYNSVGKLIIKVGETSYFDYICDLYFN